MRERESERESKLSNSTKIVTIGRAISVVATVKLSVLERELYQL